MGPRTIIVPSNSALLFDSSTRVLHRYSSGMVLVQTEAPSSEAGEETPVLQGVSLEGTKESELKKARNSLNTLQEESTIIAYVELIGPVDANWTKELKALGLELLRYQPEHSYLCRGTVGAFNNAAKEDFVLSVALLSDVLKRKMAKGTFPEAGGRPAWIVIPSSGENVRLIMAELKSEDVQIDLQQTVEQLGFLVRVRANLTEEGQKRLLKDPRILAIEAYEPVTPEDEVAGLIIAGQYSEAGQPNGSYIKWLEDKGIDGREVTISIVDNGVDTSHEAFKNRIVDLCDGKKDWHGTFVAGHAAGKYLAECDANGFIYGVGMAPGSELLAQSNAEVTSVPGKVCKESVSTKGPSGNQALVQNNSWGSGNQDPMDYGTLEAAYDALVRNADPTGTEAKPLTVCFSSGNSGSEGITRPKAAKNVIVTGNSENYRPDIGGDESDSIDDVYSGSHASSHGNCADGRVRPDIVAPGEWTSSANFDSLPGQTEYISPKLTWGGGSSGASPKTAGACALLTQWWRQHNSNKNPSPAILRALIVNGAEPMRGKSSMPPIPSKVQGWGRLNLENILTEDFHHSYVDQDFFLKTVGDKWSGSFRVSDPTRPVKITLAWTDPPGNAGTGTASTPAIVNKLILSLNSNNKVFFGNNFSDGWSIAGKSTHPDRLGWDNVQNIFLKPDTVNGKFTVVVEALEITTNCLSLSAEQPQQDFALVVANAFPDCSETPANVFILIDENSLAQPKPKEGDDFWEDSSSGEEKGTDVGSEVDNNKDTDQGDQSEANEENSREENEWWNETSASSPPETEKTGPVEVLTKEDNIRSALVDGIELIKSSEKNRIYYPNVGLKNEKSSSIEVMIENSRETVKSKLAGPLSRSLSVLMTNWEEFFKTEINASRRYVGIIIVGSGSRITNSDLVALRQLAFKGDIHVISNCREILAFLAQEIHRKSGVRYYFAKDPNGIAELIRDISAQVSGAQNVCLSEDLGTNLPLNSIHRFEITERDSRLLVQISLQIGSGKPKITVLRPNEEIEISYSSPPPNGISVSEKDGLVQLTFARPEDLDKWIGQWQLKLAGIESIETKPDVRVWVWGELDFLIRRTKLPATSESGLVPQEDLITLSSNEDACFSGCCITPVLINAVRLGEASRPEEETLKATTVVPLPSRLDASSKSENERPTANVLHTLIKTPQHLEGASVTDLAVQVTGKVKSKISNTGQAFARSFRKNFVNLEPRSSWKHRKAASEKILFVSGKVKQVHYVSGRIVGIQLAKGEKERYVSISSPSLAAQITTLNLEKANLHFGIIASKSELRSVIKMF